MESTADNLSLRVASFSCYLDTAKDNMVRRVSSLQQETTPVQAKPPFSIKFSKSKETQDDHKRPPNNLSFSNYLNTGFGSGDDNNFVFEVPGPIQDPTSAFTFSQNIKDRDEIGVFGADRYFNMKLEYKTTDHAKLNRYKNDHNNNPGPEKIVRPIKSPSLSSEASTWNSQAALLPDYNGISLSSQTKQHKRPIGRRNIFFTGFGCRGPCFDKKSVHIGASEIIDHKIAVLKPVVATANFNVPNAAKKQQVTMIKNKYNSSDDQESRKSIEVFGSSNCSAKDRDVVATNMERKLSMLTWDAIISPKSSSVKSSLVPPPTSKQSTLSLTCDDMASDASSDLFEIENISGSVYPVGDDGVMSTCMSPTISHYAPSEASIQWSVVTASAAPDRCSDCYVDDVMMMSSTKGGNGNGNGTSNRKCRGLLGCKSAVDVNHTSLCKKGNVDHKLVKG